MHGISARIQSACREDDPATHLVHMNDVAHEPFTARDPIHLPTGGAIVKIEMRATVTLGKPDDLTAVQRADIGGHTQQLMQLQVADISALTDGHATGAGGEMGGLPFSSSTGAGTAGGGVVFTGVAGAGGRSRVGVVMLIPPDRAPDLPARPPPSPLDEPRPCLGMAAIIAGAGRI